MIDLFGDLTDPGTEYCGNPEHHEYELYLALEDIDHSRTKTKSPQTNGIVSASTRQCWTSLHRVAFRKKLYASIVSSSAPDPGLPADAAGFAAFRV